MSEQDSAQIPNAVEDGLLQFIVNMANKGLQLPITLSVGGMLVSGVIISASEYIMLFGNTLGSALGDAFQDSEIQESIKQTFTALADSIKTEESTVTETERETPEEETEDKSSPTYIHLKDTKFFLSVDPGIPTSAGILWRGKISSVDGFSLGQLSAALSQSR